VPTPTHCPYCALQCAQALHATPDAVSPVRVEARDFPTNRGGMCQKGWSSAEVLTATDRLTTPLVRRVGADGGRGALGPATWEEALDLVHSRLAGIQAVHGRDAVAVFGGGGLTNEKAYTLGKFARVVLGTPYIDYNGRFCMSSAAAGANRSLGVDRGLAFPLADLGGRGRRARRRLQPPQRRCRPSCSTSPARGRAGAWSSSTRGPRRRHG
jgi:assimilatory nitrate reductase catalytic subunit